MPFVGTPLRGGDGSLTRLYAWIFGDRRRERGKGNFLFSFFYQLASRGRPSVVGKKKNKKRKNKKKRLETAIEVRSFFACQFNIRSFSGYYVAFSFHLQSPHSLSKIRLVTVVEFVIFPMCSRILLTETAADWRVPRRTRSSTTRGVSCRENWESAVFSVSHSRWKSVLIFSLLNALLTGAVDWQSHGDETPLFHVTLNFGYVKKYVNWLSHNGTIKLRANVAFSNRRRYYIYIY